jgi:hypothetical protein
MLLFPPLLYAATWLHLVEGSGGENIYLDLDSVRQTAPGIIEVQRKIEQDSTSDILTRLSDIEVNCEKKGIRLLGEIVYDKTGAHRSVQVDSTFHAVAPDDMNETLLEFVCSLKKTG